MSTDEIERNVSLLRENFAASSSDPGVLEKCVNLLESLKASFTDAILNNMTTDIGFWLLARETYEIESFECFYGQLNFFYFDYDKFTGRSENMVIILGIRLLHLLTENRIGDLYMFLELIPEDIRSNDNIKYVVDLERSMMEGNLSRLLDVNHTTPCEYYKNLAHKLADTARSKIAASMEVAYTNLSLEAATKMLKLGSTTETAAFINYYNQSQGARNEAPVHWRIDGDRITFVSEEVPRFNISPKEILVNSLKNIDELERIV